jgi:putative peptidoglycan lipid II flippase
VGEFVAGDFVKHARTLSILTIVSRVTGLGRDMALAAAFGFGMVMQAWGPAYQLPNLFRSLFGEGALTATFVPVYTELVEKKEEEAARRLACLAITVLVVLLAALTLAGEGLIWGLGALTGGTGQASDPRFDLTLGLSAVMLPFVITVCLVALLQGVLNVRGHFAAPALAPVVLNLLMIAAVVAAHYLWPDNELRQVYFVAASVVVAGVVEVVIQVPPLVRQGFRFRPTWDLASPHLRQMAVLMVPMVLSLGVVQFNTFMNQMLTQFFSPHPSGDPAGGLVTTFEFLGRTIAYPLDATANPVMNYGQRLYQLPLGVFIIALGTAIFPALSRHAAQRDLRGLAQTLNHGLRIVTVIALPCTAGLAVAALPLVRVLFEHGKFEPADTPEVATMTALYGLGLLPFSIQHLLTRAFFAIQAPKVPVRTSVIAAGVNFVLNVTFIWFLGIEGLAASTVLCATGQSLWLVWLLRQRLGRLGLRRYLATLWRCLLATAVMAVLAWLATAAVDLAGLAPAGKAHAWLALTAAVVVGFGVYVVAARLLGMTELSDILNRGRSKETAAPPAS